MIDNPEKQKEVLSNIEAFKEVLNDRNKLNDEDKKTIFEKYVELALVGNKHEHSITAVASPTQQSRSNLFGDAPFAELVRKTKLKKHSDLVLLSIYDLMMNKGNESVTTAEIMDQYKSALLKPSKNTSADIRNIRSKGFMMPGESKEGKMSFKITMSGIEYIEEVLNNAK
jgi:hypothetical protein